MQFMGLNEIREKFLYFFEEKEHLRLKSYSLVPENDKSLLLINSGMAPLKPYFTGQQVPPQKRVTTCQKCIRTGDIENVGKTARHGTFFEMLGNFSFGDYFKKEAIPWSWEFFTKVMEIPEEKLFVSVYKDDDEAFDIWNKMVGLDKSKIFRMGKEDNFWEHGTGPCGPCSEIYYDKGEKYGCGSPKCSVGCDCDRFMEIWNLVFTQFYREENGNYSNLEHPNIDTGMGLERITTVMQDVDSIFDIDTVKAIRDEVCTISGVKYNNNHKTDISIRVITDHIRSVTFMVADGVLASNEGRGYVLRRLLRRAARHGRLIGIKDKFLSDLSKVVIKVSKGAYPELEEKKEYIHKILSVEEERFYDTLNQGMEILKEKIKEIKQIKEGNLNNILNGEESFKLYDTYGFPLELMKEILEEYGIDIDEREFMHQMEEQRNRSKSTREENTYMGSEETVFNKLDPKMSTKFTGYDNFIEKDAKILAIIVDDEIAECAEEGDKVSIIADKTPFYAQSGGQTGDKGEIRNYSAIIEVNDCVRFGGNKFIHKGIVKSGEIKVSDTAQFEIDIDKRIAAARNHTATHLLQKALREVLGNHIEQAGSYVSNSRLRFDFTHFEPISKEDIVKIEKIVNKHILDSINVNISEMSKEEAREKGAMALFGEKYGDIVRVVDIGGYSIELCGGTHLKNTAQAGSFKIISESGVAAGVRRIEALTGYGAINYYEEREYMFNEMKEVLKSSSSNILKKINSIVDENKKLAKEIESLKSKMSSGIVDNILKYKLNVNGIDILCTNVEGFDMNGLRSLGDKLKTKLNSGVILLACPFKDKVNFVSMVSDDLVKKGANAGNIVKTAAEVCGGSGGGRPNMAQAGGKDKNKIKEALNKALETIKNQLSK